MGALMAVSISNYAVPPGSSLFSFSAQETQFAGLVWWAGLLVLLGAILVVWLSLLWQARISPTDGDHGESHLESHPGGEESGHAQSVAGAVSDDLTRIEGIGPKIQQVLNQAGIFTYQQLAESDTRDLEAILRQAGLRIHNPGSWPLQASLAADGDWDQFTELQGRLKGGRQT